MHNAVLNEPAASNDELLIRFGGRMPEDNVLHPSFTQSDAGSIRISIVQQDGTCYSLPYASLRFVHFDKRLLTLVFSDAVLTVHGRQLDGLYESLQTQSITQLRVVDPQRSHFAPNAAVVTRVDFRVRSPRKEESALPGFEQM